MGSDDLTTWKKKKAFERENTHCWVMIVMFTIVHCGDFGNVWCLVWSAQRVLRLACLLRLISGINILRCRMTFFFVMTVYDCWLFWSVPCCHSLNFCTTTILHPEPLQSPHSHDFCAGTTRNEYKLSHKDVDRIWLPHGIYKKSCSVKETHVNCGSAGLEFWWWTNLITKGRVKEIVGKRCAHRPCRLALLTVIFGFELGFV